VAERALGFYLLDMERRREQGATFPRAGHWAKKKLGMKRADKLILATRRLEGLPGSQSVFPGRFLTKVRYDLWRLPRGGGLEFAGKHNCEEVERAVCRARRGGLPGAGLGISRPTRVVRFPLAAERHARWEMAIRKVRHENGKGTTPADAAMYMADLVLGTDRGPGSKGARRGGGAREPHFVVVYRPPDVGRPGSTPRRPGSGSRRVARRSARGKAIEAKDVALGNLSSHGTAGGARWRRRKGQGGSPEMRAAARLETATAACFAGGRDIEAHARGPLRTGAER
jgi:hypothetical protein